MFTRLQDSFSDGANYLIKKISVVLDNRVIHYLVGDAKILFQPWRLEGRLAELAKEDPKGVGIVRFGPPVLGRNYVLVKPRTSIEAEQQLKLLMELKEDSARVPYSIFNYITDSSVFLSMNNNEGSRLRKKMLAYFNPAIIHKEYAHSMNALLTRLVHSYKPSNEIKKYIRNLFSQVFLGSELAEDMHNVLNELDTSINDYMVLPKISWRFIPEIKKLRQDFDVQAQKILRQIIKDLQNTLEEKSNLPQNFITDTLLEKCGSTLINELSENDINRLVKDQDVRLCVSILLGVNNISQVIFNCLMNREKLEKLLQEINSLGMEHIDPVRFRNKETMPYLHATYLEALRYSAPVSAIIRYSANGISTKILSVPSNSVIFFNLYDGMHEEKFVPSSINERSAMHKFIPERYLTEEGMLNEYAKLHSGILTPFGLGARRCPAVDVSEVIFKDILIDLTRHLLHFSEHSVIFSNYTIPLEYYFHKKYSQKMDGIYQSYVVNDDHSDVGNLTILLCANYSSSHKPHNFDSGLLYDLLKIVGKYLDSSLVRGLDSLDCKEQTKTLKKLMRDHKKNPTEESREKVNLFYQQNTKRQFLLHLRLPNNVDVLNKLSVALVNIRNVFAKLWLASNPMQVEHSLNEYMIAETEDKDLLEALKLALSQCPVALENVSPYFIKMDLLPSKVIQLSTSLHHGLFKESKDSNKPKDAVGIGVETSLQQPHANVNENIDLIIKENRKPQ